ncbi:MAG: hypothetical protein B6I24_02015 [Bacteroidetes bacterium 4572_128]|nr:MAG: hypothetical protein B6I24_02015 [Bacteroidetes bacterium 4572_128]
MIKKILFFSFLFVNNFIFSQIKDSSIFVPAISFSYSYQFPSGDLSDRFGKNFTIGSAFQIKTKKNWIFSVDFDYIFGDDVKEDNILDKIKTSDGLIINSVGEYGAYVFYERGFTIGTGFGKIIPLNFSNPNSGLIFKLKFLFLSHFIKIENENNDIPQIMGDYLEGYDRLTNGFAYNFSIGYFYLGESNIANFNVALEFTQASTKNRRDFNFDLMKKDNSKRNDIFYGIKISWILPFYARKSSEFYVN